MFWLTEWEIGVVAAGAVTILVLVAITWWTGRRRRPRSRPAIPMDDERRRRLRQIAASDYTPKRHNKPT